VVKVAVVKVAVFGDAVNTTVSLSTRTFPYLSRAIMQIDTLPSGLAANGGLLWGLSLEVMIAFPQPSTIDISGVSCAGMTSTKNGIDLSGVEDRVMK